MKKLILSLLCLLLSQVPALAQMTQKVRGQVIDAESRQPLPGVTVLLLSAPQLNAVTDEKGFFVIDKVPLGRQSFQFSMVGFEPYTAQEVSVISGKELELNVSLKESLQQLKEVTVKAAKDRARPLNDFAAISARAFSVEETRRYAASFADPARMVMNFPGVSNNGDDNSIVVRGNSPKGVLWRLEGIEIPNPNHFGDLGNTGGAISMLNANVLGSSDFYTGAFVPEIGNALSGAFDLNFRNGNTDRREHTVQIGTLGIELATEGPFRKGGKSSYLVNYRYSTLALLGGFLDLGGVQPNYQDGSFKLHFPTAKAGTFSVFGLGGYNKAVRETDADSTQWNKKDNDEDDNLNINNKSFMGVAGVSHQYFLGKDAYLKTVLSASYDKTSGDADTLNPSDAYRKVPIEHSDFSNTAVRLSVLYNRKLSARHTFRTGLIGQQLSYDLRYNYLDDASRTWKNVLSGNGSTQYYQGYFQWKARMTQQLTLTGGLHASYFALNGKSSIEPRISAVYQLNNGHKLSLAAGLHSKPDHPSTYLYQTQEAALSGTYPNKDLDLLRAFHAVAGYELSLPWKMRLKAEVYYQHLYNIPVEKDSSGSFSILNADGLYSMLNTSYPLVSKGTGNNYGIDLSLERPFANRYYFIATSSIFKSTYTDYAGNTYNTRFNRGYQVNLIFGKEFGLGHGGRKTIGVNGKVLTSGGQRESVIDLDKSILSRKTEYVPGGFYTLSGKGYFRTDASVYYRVNNRRATHTIQLDVQNFTNNKNYYSSYYDVDEGKIKRVSQLGILPNLSYRIDFHH